MDGQEKCQRCGEEDYDRRTLWMACFYAMNELNMPFDTEILFHANTEDLSKSKEPVAVEVGSEKEKIILESGKVRCKGDLDPHQFFTLRVCKDCRAEWLEAIKDWFLKGEWVSKRERTGTGVWIRDHGTNREATAEEVERMIQEREKPKEMT